MPDTCPACGTPVERPPDEVMRYCPNASCPGRILESIVHYASRGAMDIRGLGYERVRQLLDAGLIRQRGGPLPDPERAAGRAGPVRQAVGRPARRRDRGLEGPAALEPAVRARDPARRQDGRGAARPPVRHHAGADGGLGGDDQRRAGRRAHDRRRGGRVLRRAAQHRAGGPAGARRPHASPSRAPPAATARCRDGPTC